MLHRTTIILLSCLCQCSLLNAHVGSSEVLMQGKAGPYAVLVSVQPPDVIPGIAYVKLYVQDAGIHSASVRTVYFKTGEGGSPPADAMKGTQGQPGQYTAQVWLMSGGSASLELSISGMQGTGNIVVPVVAVATVSKELPPGTAYLLATAVLFLFILLLSIVGACVSDGTAKPGEALPPQLKKKRAASMLAAGLFALLLLLGAGLWWHLFVQHYQQYLFQPTKARFTVRQTGGTSQLVMTLDTSSGAQRSTLYPYIVPDHGKIMHLFIMRMPTMDAFAHLHPVRVNTSTFRTVLPLLPNGKYLVFADIVYVSGFTETIRDTVSVTEASTDRPALLDRDDAHAFALPNDILDNPQIIDSNTIRCGRPSSGVKLKDGSVMTWEGMDNGPLETGQLYHLTFAVTAPDGTPAVLDPYMGMAAHAAIIRSDGQVYMHLHPMGTASMAAGENFTKRMAEPPGNYAYPEPSHFQDSVDTYLKHLSGLDEPARNILLTKQMDMPYTDAPTMKGMAHGRTVSFPYAFPAPGLYRIWVQVKRNGQVLTAAFDKVVK